MINPVMLHIFFFCLEGIDAPMLIDLLTNNDRSVLHGASPHLGANFRAPTDEEILQASWDV